MQIRYKTIDMVDVKLGNLHMCAFYVSTLSQILYV